MSRRSRTPVAAVLLAAVPAASGYSGADERLRSLAAEADRAGTIVRVAVAAGSSVRLASPGPFRIVDPSSGIDAWRPSSPGEVAIVDGSLGRVYLSPDDALRREYERAQRRYAVEVEHLTRWRDGRRAGVRRARPLPPPPPPRAGPRAARGPRGQRRHLRGEQPDRPQGVVVARDGNIDLVGVRVGVARNHFPVLIKGLEVLGSPAIRNMGTIGGNIVTAPPAGDTLPPLYVLGAEIELRRKDSSRRLPLKDFIKGPGQTLLDPGEVLTGIFINKRTNWNLHHYEKVGQRKALAIAIVSLAAVINLSENGLVKEARLAWGSVAPTVVCFAEVESMLVGNRLSRQVLEEAAQVLRKRVKPIDDIRASSNYRRQVAGNILLRLIV